MSSPLASCASLHAVNRPGERRELDRRDSVRWRADPANSVEDFRESQKRPCPSQNRLRISLARPDVGVEVEAGRIVAFQRERPKSVLLDQKPHDPVSESQEFMRLPDGRTERHHLRVPYPLRQRTQIIERRIEVESQRSHPFGKLCDHGGIHVHGCVPRLGFLSLLVAEGVGLVWESSR